MHGAWADNFYQRLVAGPSPPRDLAFVRKFTADYIGERVGWLGDDDFASMLHGKFDLPGTEPTDFLHQMLELDGESALSGIRFYKLDPERPFVDLEAVTGEIGLGRWCESTLAAFRVFEPQAVRWYAPGVEPPALPDGWTAQVDQHLLVGHLGDLEPCARRVELSAADPDEAMPWLEQSYAAFGRRTPDLADGVVVATREELRGCQERGRLVWWHRAGERAGLLGVEPVPESGYDGFLVIEEAVDPAHVGHGSAAAAQGELIRLLAKDHPHKPLVGTIDGRNVSSLKTAQRNSRVIHWTWWFIKPS